MTDRWYVFEAPSGTLNHDQPRRGFRSARQAWEWLRWSEADLRCFTVALGNDPAPREGEGDDGENDEREQQRVDEHPAEQRQQQQNEDEC